MKLLELYLLSRIDRALDDGKPLTGWTRRFVQRNKRLRRYYESMLALELELRFSDDGGPIAFAEKNLSVSQKSRLPLAIGAAVAIGLLIAVGLVYRSETPVFPPLNSIVETVPVDDTVREMSAAVSLDDFDGTGPVESLLDFSERPLELTSMLLAGIGSVVAESFSIETPEMQAN